MKILLIEDEDRSIDSTTNIINGVFADAALTVVTSRNDAFAAIEDCDFDLVICDLNIPSTAGSLDISEDHGKAVHTMARARCTGTPLIFLTAFWTGKNTKNELSAGGTADMFGLFNHPIVQLATKDDPDEIENYLREFANGLTALEHGCRVNLTSADPDGLLSRALRMYALQIGAGTVNEIPLSGLSKARVSKATFVDINDQRASVVIKISNRNDSVSEFANYQQYVPNRLSPGFFAPALPPILHGLRSQAANFYTLADGSSISLFKLLRRDPAEAARAVSNLRTALRPWTGGNGVNVDSVGALRRQRTPDSLLDEYIHVDQRPQKFEEEIVESNLGIIHGDLHGENVMVDQAGRPLLIDFGDTGVGPRASDPVTLEMSILFHKDGPAVGQSWPTITQLESWWNLDMYVEGSPYAEFIRECRAWLLDTSPDSKSWRAAAYVHALRQLKYSDTDKPRCLAIARGLSRSTS